MAGEASGADRTEPGCVTRERAIQIITDGNKGAHVVAYWTGDIARKFRSVQGPAEEVIVFRRRAVRTSAWVVQFRNGCAVAENAISLDTYWALAGMGT